MTCPLVILTSFGDEQLAVEIMKSGAIDYRVKSGAVFREMPLIARRALREWKNLQERRRAEAAARESQKRLADVISFLPDAVIAIDDQGRVIAWNHTLENLTGIPAQEMLGKGDYVYGTALYGKRQPLLIDLVLHADPEREKEFLTFSRRGDTLIAENFSPVLRNGRGGYLWGTASPLFNTAGERIGAIEVIRDITESRQAEKQLLLKTIIFEAALTANSIADTRGIITDCNPAFLSTWGLSQKKDAVGRTIISFFKDANEASGILKTLDSTGRWEGEFIARREDGSLFPALGTATTIRDASGAKIGYQSSCFDITDQKRAEHALQESENKYRILIDNVRDIVWRVTPDLTFTYISPSVERLTGYAPGELLGKNLLTILTESSQEYIRQRLAARMKEYQEGGSDLATIFEAQMRKKDGDLIWLEISSNPLFGPDHSLMGFHGITRDVTGRKQAETALMESEIRFKDLFDNMRAGVVIYEPASQGEDFLIRDINHAVEVIETVKKEEIVGRSVLEVFPGVREFGLFDVFQRVSRTGTAESHPVSQYRDTRIAGWRENYVFRLPSGEVVALYEDVTAKKQAEAAVQESNDRFRIVAHTTNDTIWDWNLKTDELWWNEGITTVFGYPAADVEPSIVSWYNRIHPDDQERVVSGVHQIIDDGGVNWSDEYRFRKADGTWAEVVDRGAIIRDPEGRPVRMVGAIVDRTEQKAAERILKASEARYRLLADNISDVLWVLNIDTLQWNYVSPSVERLRGFTAGEVMLQKMEEVVTPASYAYIQKVLPGRIRQFVENESGANSYIDEIEQTCRDGSAVWTEVSTRFLRNERGEITVLGVSRNISERKQSEDALKKSRFQLSAAMDLANLVNWEYDAVTGIFTFNDPFYALYGTTAEREGGYQMPADVYAREFVHPDDGPLVAEAVKQAMESTDPHFMYQGEHRIIRRDGEIRTIIVRFGVTKDESGRTVKTHGANQDITDRKKAEEAIRTSEEKYRTLFDNMLEAFAYCRMLFSPDGKPEDFIFLEVNAAFNSIIGIPGILNRRVSEVIPGVRAHFPGIFETYARVLQTGRPEIFDLNFTAIGKWLNLSLYAQSDEHFIAVFTDITERKLAEQRLRESEQKFRTVADYTYDWEYWVLPDGNYQYISPSCERITGYTPEEFYRDPDLLKKITHPDDQLKLSSHTEFGLVDDTSEGGLEFRIISKTGKTVWLGHLCRPLYNAEGEFIGRRGSNRDITQRRQAEDALRQSEIRFRALIQNSSDIIRVLDGNGLVTYESPSSERILGYPRGFMIGRSPLDLIHPADRDRVSRDLTEVITRKNNGIPTAFRIRKADGGYLWVDSIGTNLLDNPEVNGIVITTRPIQQRKEAEQALLESEERLRLSLEGADAGFWDWDLVTGNAVFSDRFYTMLDYQPGEFPASYDAWVALMHPEDRERVLPDLQQQIRERRPSCEIEYRCLSKDGDWIWILGKGKITSFDEKGNPARMVGVNIDITNRRMMESEIKSLNAALEQRVKDRTEALSRANEALEEENAQRLEAEKQLHASVNEKSMLLKEIHHRVKNNLQIIVSLLNLQSRYIHDESTLAAIRESQNRVKAMALVHEKLYRTEDLSHISLEDYVKFLGSGLFQFYDAKSRGIRFHLDIHDVWLDINTAIPLGLIINELISNALKYAFPEGRGGEVMVSVHKVGPAMTVVIRDDGIGIPVELDWKNTQSLGLRLVNTLVDQLEGTIELDRSGGTMFTMVLQERR